MNIQLKMTPEELDTIALCLRHLTEEQIAQCNEAAKQAVVAALRDENYADLLVYTCVPLMLRHLRKARMENTLRTDKAGVGGKRMAVTEQKTDDTTVRGDIEADVVQQVANEVQETILRHAPETWSNERCEEVEEAVLSHTRSVISALTADELRSSAALHHHIEAAIAETKAVLQGWR